MINKQTAKIQLSKLSLHKHYITRAFCTSTTDKKRMPDVYYVTSSISSYSINGLESLGKHYNLPLSGYVDYLRKKIQGAIL